MQHNLLILNASKAFFKVIFLATAYNETVFAYAPIEYPQVHFIDNIGSLVINILVYIISENQLLKYCTYFLLLSKILLDGFNKVLLVKKPFQRKVSERRMSAIF